MQERGASGLRAEAEVGTPDHQQVDLAFWKLALALTFSIPRNLHSHHFSSPLTNQQEVSAFGEMGEGDTGDVWKVMIVTEKWNKIVISYQRLCATPTTGSATRRSSSST